MAPTAPSHVVMTDEEVEDGRRSLCSAVGTDLLRLLEVRDDGLCHVQHRTHVVEIDLEPDHALERREDAVVHVVDVLLPSDGVFQLDTLSDAVTGISLIEVAGLNPVIPGQPIEDWRTGLRTRAQKRARFSTFHNDSP